MNETVEKHIRALQNAILQTNGEVRALKFVLDVVIESHPRPLALFQTWQSTLPELTDELIADAGEISEQKREGWKRVLSHFSELFQALADREKREGRA